MANSVTHNQTFSTPQEALAHYGVKGMKWGVRKNDRPSNSTVGTGDGELGPLIAVVAIFAGIQVIKARYNYVDSGRKDQKAIEKAEKKSGVKHEWKKNDSLKGPKTIEELEKGVIPAINPGFPRTPGTSMNCRRCTFAYELRRRGLDVKATKSMMATGQDDAGLINATSPRGPDGSIRKTSLQSGWGKNRIPTTTDGRRLMSPEDRSKSIYDTLAKQPNGARGELAFSWAFGGGHSVAYEIVNNSPVVFCTQTGKTFPNSQSFANDYGQIVGEAAYTRLDNAKLNDDFLRRWVADA